MPSSPISKDITLPDNWVQLQKVIISDQATDSYWGVWYDIGRSHKQGVVEGKAWLMWCPFGDDPSVNDSWGNAEEIDGDCKNALDVIESVYGVSFHESIWVELPAKEFPLSE